jgi:hypothetical protein
MWNMKRDAQLNEKNTTEISIKWCIHRKELAHQALRAFREKHGENGKCRFS